MDPRIAPVWNALFLATAVYCVALFFFFARRETNPGARARALRWVSFAALAYLGVSHALARSAWLDQWELFPPPAMRVFFPLMALSVYLGAGPLGRFLGRVAGPALLVGAQVFRVPVELCLHGFVEVQAFPPQLSYGGLNFDIVSGLLALPVAIAWARGRIGVRGLVLYNVVGLALLLNIVVLALLSMPTPLRAFEGMPNTLVVQPVYIWLPTVMVQTALVLHVATLRWAWQQRSLSARAETPAASA